LLTGCLTEQPSDFALPAGKPAVRVPFPPRCVRVKTVYASGSVLSPGRTNASFRTLQTSSHSSRANASSGRPSSSFGVWIRIQALAVARSLHLPSATMG
jgi:hypothetical protein